jgi:hypothetical protein
MISSVDTPTLEDAMAEPQITEIASYFADHLPSDDVDPVEARDSWRRTLRHARRVGAIRWLTQLVAREAPEDRTLQAHCAALRR